MDWLCKIVMIMNRRKHVAGRLQRSSRVPYKSPSMKATTFSQTFSSLLPKPNNLATTLLAMRKSQRSLNKLIVDLSQAPVRPNICAGCNHVFEYPQGAPWSETFQLVCEHSKTCLIGIRQDNAMRRRELTLTLFMSCSEAEEATHTDSEGTSPTVPCEDTPPPMAKRARAVTHSSAVAGSLRRIKKNVMDKGARRQLIESDSWARNATAKSVECRGCGRTIKLDKRSDYYPGLWHKHRNKCPAIRRMEDAGKRTKVWLMVLFYNRLDVLDRRRKQERWLRGGARDLQR